MIASARVRWASKREASIASANPKASNQASQSGLLVAGAK